MADAEHVDAHVKTALVVFVALLVLTGATVAAWAWLDLSTPMTIALALLIATIKGSLVAAWFMHLIDEKKLVHYVLVLTFSFFFVLILVPVWTSLADQANTGGPLPTPAAEHADDPSGH